MPPKPEFPTTHYAFLGHVCLQGLACFPRGRQEGEGETFLFSFGLLPPTPNLSSTPLVSSVSSPSCLVLSSTWSFKFTTSFFLIVVWSLCSKSLQESTRHNHVIVWCEVTSELGNLNKPWHDKGLRILPSSWKFQLICLLTNSLLIF